MNISRHPELLDRLAAAYALGTLRGAARRRFEQLARDQAPVRAAALLWQGRSSALSEMHAPLRPDDPDRVRIHNAPQARKSRAPPARRTSRSECPRAVVYVSAGALVMLATLTRAWLTSRGTGPCSRSAPGAASFSRPAPLVSVGCRILPALSRPPLARCAFLYLPSCSP